MQITVTVPDELVREAEARGVSVEAYAEQMLWQGFFNPSESAEQREKAVDDMLGFAKKHGLRLGEGERITDLIREARKYK